MALSQVQRPILGFFLALTTGIMWGALPIAIKQVLKGMDVQTIVWYRFFTAGICLFIFLGAKKRLPPLKGLSRRYFSLFVLAILGLAGNFELYNLALRYIPPTTSQILSPVSAFLMLLAGVWVFKEKMWLNQKIGLGMLLFGLGLFFNQHLEDFLQFNLYGKGVVIGLSAALVWIFYGIGQKMLLAKFTASQILCVIYLGCFVILTPSSDPTQILNLTPLELGSLIFCCANTLIAYGCYGEALNHWDVAKVSAVITQTPIFTMIFSVLLAGAFPHIFQMESLNLVSYLGAGVVVLGALVSAIGHKFIHVRV